MKYKIYMESEEEEQESTDEDKKYVEYQTDITGPSRKRQRISRGYKPTCIAEPSNCTLQLSTGYVFSFKKKDGYNLLLPQWFESNIFVRKIVSQCLRSIILKLTHLSNLTDEEGYDNDGNITYYDLKEQVLEAYIVEMRLRNAMRNVLMHWRNYQINKYHEDIIDPITLSEPEKRIVLYDWNMKRKFIFDAKSIAIHIETALLYQEEGFSLPRYPRNPWTNIAFTYRQLVSIYEQLKIHGELRWAFVTLRKCNFNKEIWRKYQHAPITMNTIRNSLIHLDSMHARDLLEDFIILKINEVKHVTTFIVNVYRAAIAHMPHHGIIERWKRIAFLHYENDYFGTNHVDKINKIRAVLLKKQPRLIHDLREKGLIPE